MTLPVDRARLIQVLEKGANVGVHALFVAPTTAALPAICRSFVDVDDGLEDATIGLVRSGSGTSTRRSRASRTRT